MTDELYLYALTHRMAILPPLQGFAPVYPVIAGAVQALVSEVPAPLKQAPILANEQNMAQLAYTHHQLLQSLLRNNVLQNDPLKHYAPIPVRFGTIIAGESTLQGLLQVSEAPLLAALETLQGKCEWDIKLHVDQATAEKHIPEHTIGGTDTYPSNQGTQYMLRKSQERRSRIMQTEHMRRTIVELQSLIESHEALWHCLPCRQGECFHAAVLLTVTQTQAFLRAAHTFETRLSGALRVSGPWPAYSFAPQLHWN